MPLGVPDADGAQCCMMCHGRPQQVVVHTDRNTGERHRVCCECLRDHFGTNRQTEFNCPICRVPLNVDEVDKMLDRCVLRYNEIREDRARTTVHLRKVDQNVDHWRRRLRVDKTPGINTVSSLTEDETALIDAHNRPVEGTWRGPRTHPETPMAQLRYLTDLNRPLNEPTANHRNRTFDLLDDQRSHYLSKLQQNTRYMNILRNTADKLQQWVQACFPVVQRGMSTTKPHRRRRKQRATHQHRGGE